MSGPFVAVDPLAEAGWDELLATHPECLFFHTASWARVLSSSYGYVPLYLAAVKDGCLDGLIPFMEIRSPVTGIRGVSLPFTDVCDLILPRGTGYEQALGSATKLARSRGWATFELRGRVAGMETVPASAEYYLHDLDLSEGEESVLSRIRDNVRRNIRKAEREGVIIENEESAAALRRYYRLHCLTRREHGIPPQPFRFFERLGEHVLAKGNGTLLMARKGKKYIAGAVFLHHRGRAVFKFGASDRRHQHLRANNLVMWEAIRSYIGRRFRSLSFGRTDLDHDGLRQFKVSWGCSERVLRYSRYLIDSGAWQVGTARHGAPWKAVFCRLPVPVLRAVGAIAYGHVG